MSSIALFGGAFNPPHLGHVLCATWAWAAADIDEVWVLPVADHPYGKDLLAWDVRWRLCEAAFSGLGFVRLCDDERRNPGGRTFTLLQGLRARHPGHRWHLIGGSDTEADLGNWYRGAELKDQVTVIPVPRRGYDEQDPLALPAISSSAVRQAIAVGGEWRRMVPAAVAAIIADAQLYRP